MWFDIFCKFTKSFQKVFYYHKNNYTKIITIYKIVIVSLYKFKYFTQWLQEMITLSHKDIFLLIKWLKSVFIL